MIEEITMREIKFRVWDGERMWIPHSLMINGQMRVKPDYHFHKQGAGGHARAEVLMQYIGLDDKNDNPIYEGDVISYGYWDGGEWEEDWRAAVAYDPPGFSLNPWPWDVESDEYYQPRGAMKSFLTESEVIGNIYENPDLLEQ